MPVQTSQKRQRLHRNQSDNRKNSKQIIQNAANEVITRLCRPKPDCLSFDQDELMRLKKALRRERILGLSGHWSYDINRHFYLVQCLVAAHS